MAVALSLFASFAVAMTVVPLFCARFIKAPAHHGTPVERSGRHGRPCEANRRTFGDRFNLWFNARFESFLKFYDRAVALVLRRPAVTLAAFGARVRGEPRDVPDARALLLPAHRRRPVRHQRESPHGHADRRNRRRGRQGGSLIRRVVSPEDLGMIVSNIGTTPDFSAIYTTNSGCTRPSCRSVSKRITRPAATSTWRGSRSGSQAEMPELSAYFSSGGLVDAVLNLGLPAPIDVQVAGSQHEGRVRYREPTWPPQIRRSTVSPMFSFRRTSTIRRCGSMWTARAPASSDSISAKWSAT